MWCSAFSYGLCVCVVEEGEGEELRDQGVFDWEEEGGPCYGGGDDSGSVAGVAVDAAVFCPF